MTAASSVSIVIQVLHLRALSKYYLIIAAAKFKVGCSVYGIACVVCGMHGTAGVVFGVRGSAGVVCGVHSRLLPM